MAARALRRLAVKRLGHELLQQLGPRDHPDGAVADVYKLPRGMIPWSEAVEGSDRPSLPRREPPVAVVASTGERELLFPFLTADIEWDTPRRDLAGIDEVRMELTWITAPENFDLEFEVTQMNDLGDGRIVTDVHELYRTKGTGEVAHTRDRRIELTIRAGKIARYERER